MASYDGDIELRVNLTEGNITDAAERLRTKIEDIFKRASKNDNLSTSMKSMLASMDKAYLKSGKLLDALDKVKNERIPTDIYKDYEKQLEGIIDKLYELRIKLSDTQKGSEAAAAIEKQIKSQESMQNIVSTRMQALRESGAAYRDAMETDAGKAKYQEILDVLKATNDQMTILGQRANETKELGPDFSLWKEFATALGDSETRLNAIMGLLAGLASGAIAGGIGVIAGIFKRLAGVAKTAAIHLGEMAKNLAKSVAGGIIHKLKSLGSTIAGVGKKTKSSNDAFKMGFRTLLRYGFGIRSVYFLFRRLRKALGEGIGNLAQYSPAFNTVISNFISALTRLKNSFATAFAPIINVVAPIITTFLNMMSDAVTKVGMLIAAITGQKTFIRAKAVQEDYAASLDKSSKSTDKANKSAEKYKRTLAGFDDVEILKNPDSDSSSGGSGSSGGGYDGVSPQDMFETVAMPSMFESWADKIKKAWEKADFTDLGKVLGKKIATALGKIPWKDIKKTAAKFGKSLATFINGLVSVEDLGKKIGTTIGEAINTIFVAANSFVTNIDETKIGTFFADILNNAVSKIKWALIGTTIATGINKIFSNAKAFAKKFNFTNLGTSVKTAITTTLNKLNWDTISGAVSGFATGLADFINGLFTSETFNSLGSFLANAINTGIKGIKDFTIELNTDDLGSGIASGINTFFEKVDLVEAGVTFSTLTSKILGGLAKAVEGAKWYDIGVKIKDGIKAIKWDEVFSNAAELAGAFAGGLAALLAGLFSDVTQGIKDFFADPEHQTGPDIAAGLLMGIGDFFKNCASWVYDNILKPFVEGVKKAFVIGSPAKEKTITDAGSDIGEGIGNSILDGLLKPFADIVNWVKTNIVDKIKQAFTDNPPTIDPIQVTYDFVTSTNDNDLQPDVGTYTPVSAKEGVESGMHLILGMRDEYGNSASSAFSSWMLQGGSTLTRGLDMLVKKALGSDEEAEALAGLKGGTTKRKLEQNVDFDNSYNKDAYHAAQLKEEELNRSLTQKVLKGSGAAFSKEALDATKITVAKITRKLTQKVFKGSGQAFNKDAVEASKLKPVTWIRKLTQKVFRGPGKAFDSDAVAASKLTGGETKRKLSQSAVKGTWKDAAWSAAQKSAETVKRGLEQTVQKVKGHWDDTAWEAANKSDKEITIKLKAETSGGNKVKSLYEKFDKLKESLKKLSELTGKSAGSFMSSLGGQAKGGAFYKGAWHNIAQYATGGIPTHGTMFVAGERGTEAVGHINGRTEVLNQSQMAAVMYTAVLNGTSGLRSAITSHMTLCTNAVITNIGSILTAFNFVSSQLYDLKDLTSLLNSQVNDIVIGKVVPTGINAKSDDVIKALNAIANKQTDFITREDLRAILRDTFKEYMNISFYMGDEQIARHANAGNLRLNRRYNTI